mgnify:CR=1 FL=1
MWTSATSMIESNPQPAAGDATENARATVDALYRSHSRQIFATLVRLIGDFDRAEEALQDAFRAAVEQWPSEGVPANPRAWLVSAGRFKAIDKILHTAKNAGLRAGIFCVSPDYAKSMFAKGFDLVTVLSDAALIGAGTAFRKQFG